MKRYRIQLVMAFIVLVCGVSLMGLVYILFNNHSEPITPGIVVSHPCPVAEPMQPAHRTLISPSPSRWVHATVPSYQPHTTSSPSVPTMPMRGLYETSRAQTHSVGGGGNGYGIAATSNASSARGIQYGSTAMPSTSFIAMASSRTIAQPGSVDAPQLARISSSPNRVPGTPDDEEEEEEVQQPIGDALPVLLLLAMTYAAVLGARRTRKTSPKS